MNKEEMYKEINDKFEELKASLEGDDLLRIRELTLELHALVHPAEISGREEKTIADLVLDHMLAGNQNEVVPRETWDTDLHYAGTKTVPICWQFWHTYRIEDLVSNILMENGRQIFNEEWQKRINSSITDTGNALEYDEVFAWGRLTVGGMILTPMTSHHMMHLPTSVEKILGK